MKSAFAKLGRAKTHLAELQKSVDEFRAADLSSELSHRVTYPYGDSDPRAVVTLSLQLRAPEEWSLIIGDILTNLRAALDHAVYGHAVSRQTLNSQQRKRLYHPMSTASADWDSTPEMTRPDGSIKPARTGIRESLQDLLDPDVLAVIENNQPFNSADGPVFWHGLAIHSGLVNRDKHRQILNIPINIAELALGSANLDIIGEKDPIFLPDGTVEKEFTVRRRQAKPGGPLLHSIGLMQTNTAFLEEIEIPNTDERRSFIDVMERLVALTETYLNELKEAGC